MLLYFLYIFLSSVLTSPVQALEVASAEYEVQSSILLGRDLTTVNLRVVLDEDLYLVVPSFCLSPPSCPKVGDHPEDFCDYSSLDEQSCGHQSTNASSQSSQCQLSSVCDQSQYTWLTLSADQPRLEIEIQAFQTVYFRFYFAPEQCSGFVVQTTGVYGGTRTSIKKGSLVESQDPTQWNYGTNFDFLRVCPFQAFYGFGTWFGGVWSGSGSAKIELELKTFGVDINNQKTIHSPEEVRCPSPASFGICPQFGQPLNQTISVSSPMLVRMTFTSCTQFMLHREILSTRGDMAMFFKQDSPTSTATGFVVLYDVVMTVCPAPGRNTTDVWITVVTSAPSLQILFYLSTNKSEWNSQQLAVNQLGTFDGLDFVQGFSQLRCPQKVFGCYPVATFGGCNEYWISMPRKDNNFLWPVPTILQDSVTSQVVVEEPQNSTDLLVSNELHSTLIVESYSNSQAMVSLQNWTQQIEECSLVFNCFSILASREGNQILLETVPLKGKRKEQSCEFDSFKKVSEQIKTLGDQLKTEQAIGEIISIRYLMDALTFEWDWQGCNDNITSMLIPRQESYKFLETKTCTIDMIKNETLRSSDSCCNENLQWSVCCTERTVQTTRDFLTLPTQQLDTQLLGSSSENEDCVLSLLEDYIFYDTLRHSTTPCEGVVTQSLDSVIYNGLEFYQNCKAKFFGPQDGDGLPCFSDNDCLGLGTETCDIFRGRCLFNNDREHQITLFFECLVEDMSISVRNELTKRYFSETFNSTFDHEASEDELVEYLRTNFVSEDCNSDIGKSPQATHYERSIALGPILCGPSNWFCYDPFCPVPIYLEGTGKFERPGSICGSSTVRKSSRETTCSSFMICNWNSSLSFNYLTPLIQQQQISNLCENKTATTTNNSTNNQNSSSNTQYFCSFCVSESRCVSIEGVNSQEECESGRFCLKPNGEVNGEIQDEKECEEQWGSCSVDCSTSSSSSCTKAQCSTAGRCSDSDIIKRVKYLMNPFNPTGVPSSQNYSLNYNGLCVSAMNLWNNGDCSVNGSLTANKNSSYALQDFPLGDVCVRIRNKTDCEKFSTQGFRWIPQATNEEGCTSEMESCSELNIPSELQSSKDPEQCELCQSNYTSVFSWSKGEWTGGRLVSGQWKRGSMVGQYWWGEGVNFENISQTFKQILSKQYAFQLITQAQCRLNPNRLVIERISCVSQKGYSSCLSLSDSEYSVASSELCVNTSTKVVAPPSTILFGKEGLVMDSTSSYTSDGTHCLTMTVQTEQQEGLKESTESLLSLSFRKQNKHRRNVWNKHSIGIGNTIGNGIRLTFDSSFDTLVAEQICLFYQLNGSLDQQHVLDFGHLDLTSNKLIPLEVQTYFDEGLICIQNMSITSEMNTFFPITREKSWKSTTSEYSSAQDGIYALMVLLYFIPCSLLVKHELQLGFGAYYNRFFNLAFLLALIIRFCYFLGLLIAQPTGTITVLEFIAVELPTFCYLSAVSGAAMLWGLITHPRSRRLVRRLTILINLLIYGFFILCTVLFFSFQANGSYSCFGRVYTAPSTSSQDNLRVIYSSIILALSVVLASCVVLSSGILISQVRSLDNPRIKAWMVVTLVVSLSVILQCVFAMVYSLSIPSSYEYSLVLILLEILPASSILHIVLVVDKLNSTGTASQGGKSSAPKESTLPDLTSKEDTN